jgi:hypothetical protein
MPSRLLREGIIDSEAVNAVSFPAEVFYRRLMSVVDDFGRFDGRPSVLRSRLYPLKVDTVREADISRWIAECVKAGLIALYAVNRAGSPRWIACEKAGLAVSGDERPYILFPKLGSPRSKESRYPDPPISDNRSASAQMFTDENICTQTRADVPYSGSGSGSGASSGAGKSPLTPLSGGTISADSPESPAKRKRDPGGEAAPIPTSLGDGAFPAVWAEWIAERKARKKPLTLRAAQKQLQDLEPLGPERASECVRASIRNQWQGIFPEKFQKRPEAAPGAFPAKPGSAEYALGIIQDALEDE